MFPTSFFFNFQSVIGSLDCTTQRDPFHSWHTCVTPPGTNGNGKHAVREGSLTKTAGV